MWFCSYLLPCQASSSPGLQKPNCQLSLVQGANGELQFRAIECHFLRRLEFECQIPFCSWELQLSGDHFHIMLRAVRPLPCQSRPAQQCASSAALPSGDDQLPGTEK